MQATGKIWSQNSPILQQTTEEFWATGMQRVSDGQQKFEMLQEVVLAVSVQVVCRGRREGRSVV